MGAIERRKGGVDAGFDVFELFGRHLFEQPQPILTADAQRRISRAAYTKGSGAEKLANYFVGQIVGSMNVTKSARQVVLDMVTEYADVVGRFAAEAADI